MHFSSVHHVMYEPPLCRLAFEGKCIGLHLMSQYSDILAVSRIATITAVHVRTRKRLLCHAILRRFMHSTNVLILEFTGLVLCEPDYV